MWPMQMIPANDNQLRQAFDRSLLWAVPVSAFLWFVWVFHGVALVRFWMQ
jgi:hypothetical protein